MAERDQLARPVMPRAAGLKPHQARRQRSEELQQLVAPDRLGDHNAPEGLWCELRERSITCRQIVRTIELTKVLNMDELFKGRHFDREIIVLCVRWYLRYQLSFRDLVEMMAERGLSLAHTTIMRWI